MSEIPQAWIDELQADVDGIKEHMRDAFGLWWGAIVLYIRTVRLLRRAKRLTRRER